MAKLIITLHCLQRVGRQRDKHAEMLGDSRAVGVHAAGIIARKNKRTENEEPRTENRERRTKEQKNNGVNEPRTEHRELSTVLFRSRYAIRVMPIEDMGMNIMCKFYVIFTSGLLYVIVGKREHFGTMMIRKEGAWEILPPITGDTCSRSR